MKSLTVAICCLLFGTVLSELELCFKMCNKNTVSRTSTGKTCQRWDRQWPHEHNYGFLGDQENYCRNPSDQTVGPWCYTTDPNTRWELCCDCRTTSTGTDYRGIASRTINGETCQRWDSQSPHAHNYDRLANQENYCRNPSNSAFGPWCYTAGKRRWDECDVPPCSW